ncbi:MAG: hypothetical protein Q4B43_01185 [Bacteroidota bacterium]|nr:hypothetical protein [Bacteroidota bacterium]
MSITISFVEELTQKTLLVISKLEQSQQDNNKLHEELRFYKERFVEIDQEMNKLQLEIQTLKKANALLGSNDFKRETKNRINAIIKEIDHCIVKLSE